MPNRKPYPSDVSGEEWAFVAPYLALVREDAPQRAHDLREVFKGKLPDTGGGWTVLLFAGAALIGGGWFLVRRFSR